MRWNPYLNAIGAAAYLWGIALLIQYISASHHNTPDNVVGAVAAFSLFTFSAAVMAFLFFYRPVMLLAEKKKEEAISFFLKTLATFGVITLIVVVAISV